MKKHYVFIVCTIFIWSIIAATHTSVPTITYFPPDETVVFDEQMNKLDFTNNSLQWKVHSKTNTPTYLRQDVAMLYRDGIFVGFINTWKNNEQTLAFEHVFSNPKPGMYESLSYHYSETHHNNDIRSAASMGFSFLELACTHLNCTVVTSGDRLDDSIREHKHVQDHWDTLITHFSIEADRYKKISLIQLVAFHERSLPTLSEKETKYVMDHLWEGLYANYIIELMETNEKQREHYVPLVLIKDDEIQVLYEVNGKKEQLIQQLKD